MSSNLEPWTRDASDYEGELKPNDVKIVCRFGESYIKPLFVIVEMYDRKSYGKGKREYQKRFTEAERKVINRYYSRLYDWYLRTGIPCNGVVMSPATLELLQRASNFFASL